MYMYIYIPEGPIDQIATMWAESVWEWSVNYIVTVIVGHICLHLSFLDVCDSKGLGQEPKANKNNPE